MSLRNFKNGFTQKGSVLVLVLIVVSCMTILSVGLAYRTQIELKLAHANAQRTKAYYLALGGIERTKTLLSQEEPLPPTITKMCQFTDSAKQEELFGQLKNCEVAGGELLIYSLRDELGYININKSDPASWENIRSISKEHLSSILDWIDADDDTNPNGAETDFYERLEPPYASKNSSCIALKELLFLKGVTRSIYLRGDLNRNPSFNENDRAGQFIIPSGNGDENLDSGFVRIFTVYGDGRININTASNVILSALPGLDTDVADVLLAHRAGPDGRLGTDDDICLADTEDITNVEGLTELQTELLQQYCCFNSQYFRIFSYANLNDGPWCCLMATVKYTENQPQVLCLERLL